MGFSITDMLNKDTSMAAAPVKEHTIERISYSKLVPSEDNFYSMQEIEELKTAIELAGRVLNNLVVTPLEDGKYKILSGHRRHRAVGMLLDEGKTEYEFLPCSVEQIEDADRAVREPVLLIAANSQRVKTAWDKLEEVRRMRDLQRQAKAERGLNGRVRDLVARSLNISSSRVAKYDSILNNLIPSLMEEIKADNLPISTAYELSKLNTEQQQATFTCFVQTGKLQVNCRPAMMCSSRTRLTPPHNRKYLLRSRRAHRQRRRRTMCSHRTRCLVMQHDLSSSLPVCRITSCHALQNCSAPAPRSLPLTSTH